MRRSGYGAARRWAIAGGLVAVLLSLPALIGLLPASDSSASAADLRAAVLRSGSVPFSGYAESAGGLALPVGDQLTSVADLFSDRTTMRVWWRGPIDNRVDVVSATGETDVHRDQAGTWTWRYEDARATFAEQTALTLPTAPDLLPSTLGRRLLSEARDDELSRLGARRVAGRDAAGLRLVPADGAASVARVDLWVDEATGLPLWVQVFGDGGGNPALDTRFLDLDLATPPASVTAFTPPAGAFIGRDDSRGVLDDAGRQLRPVPLPDTLAGLPRRQIDGAPPGVGLYGRGITLLAVVPVPGRFADDLRRAAAASPDAVTDEVGTRLAAGPVGVLLVDAPGRGSWVLTGTVTLAALTRAAGELPELGGRS